MPSATSAPRFVVDRRPDTDRTLLRYARDHDRRDLETLVLRYRPLALSLARRYGTRDHGGEDLDQVACMGLIKALKRFDPARECAFTSFAVPTILGELRRFCRDTGWSAHVPRGMQERVAAVRNADDTLAATQGRTPSVADIAKELGWSCEEVLDAIIAASTRGTVPLERDSDDSTEAYSLTDSLGDVDPGFELVESLWALESSMPALTPGEKRVLRLRFGEDLGLSDIARSLSIAESQVSRCLTSALSTLREAMDADDGSERPQHCPSERRRPPVRAPRRRSEPLVAGGS